MQRAIDRRSDPPGRQTRPQAATGTWSSGSRAPTRCGSSGRCGGWAAGRWFAGAAGAMRHVSKNRGRFGRASWTGAEPWWGATATGLPLLGGLIRIDELREGHIDHALAMAIPDARQGVWGRARRLTVTATPTSPNALPEGAPPEAGPGVDLEGAQPAAGDPISNGSSAMRDRGSGSRRSRRLLRPGPVTDGKGSLSRDLPGRYPDELLANFPWRRFQVLSSGARPRSMRRPAVMPH